MSQIAIIEKARQISKELGEPDFLLKIRLQAASALRQRGLEKVEDFDSGLPENQSMPSQRGCKAESLAEACRQKDFRRALSFCAKAGFSPNDFLLSLALFSSGSAAWISGQEEAPAVLERDGSIGYAFDAVVFAEKSKAALIYSEKHRADGVSGLFAAAKNEAEAQICLAQANSPHAQRKLGAVVEAEGKAKAKILRSNIGGKSQQDSFCILQAKRQSRCEHYNASLMGDGQRMRLQSEHFHLAPSTYSRSVFHFGAAGNSQVEAEAKVVIEQPAPQSDTHLLAKSMPILGNPRFRIVPQLFVRNCEVSAGHGSAVSSVDEEELFYLQSRGIDESEGRRMVLEGFFSGLIASAGLNPKIAAVLSESIRKRAKEVFDGQKA